MSRVHLVPGKRCFTCSKCGSRLLWSERNRDGARTSRLWVDLAGVEFFTESPPANGRQIGNCEHDGAGFPKEPLTFEWFANVHWPGPPDTPVYTLAGECPRCHGRVRLDTQELWARAGWALITFGA